MILGYLHIGKIHLTIPITHLYTKLQTVEINLAKNDDACKFITIKGLLV